MQPLDPRSLSLLDRWQRGFPLTPEPYAVLARDAGATTDEIVEALERLSALGILSRVGATIRPNTAGASLLCAMRVPQDRLEAVAAIVNEEPGVNHNYEREHAFNLWFVLTGASPIALGAALERIRRASGLEALELPLEKSYFIDLGFPLSGIHQADPASLRKPTTAALGAVLLDDVDRALLAALGPGLAICSRPYRALGAMAGLKEDETISRLSRLIASGVISRFGLILRHRALGYTANAMAVWDVADARVDEVGELLARQPSVTLCYRRPRRLPHWPFNLFCMVHGRERNVVAAEIEALSNLAGLERNARAVLFSRHCFRQRGACLKAA